MEVNYALIIFLILTMILLFTIMVFSAMSGVEINKSKCKSDDEGKEAHKNTTIAAIIAGIAVVVVLASLIIYIVVSRKDIAKDTAEKLRAAHEAVAAYAANSPASGMVSPDVSTADFTTAASIPAGVRSSPT